MRIFLTEMIFTISSGNRINISRIPNLSNFPKRIYIRLTAIKMRSFLEISFEEMEESVSVSIDSKGRMIVPAEYIKRFGFKKDDEFMVFSSEDEKSYFLIAKEKL